MKKEFLIYFWLVAIASFVWILPAEALTLTNASSTPAAPYGGRVGSYIVSFNVALDIAMPHDVRIIFPAEFTVPSTMATSSITVEGIGAAAVSTASISGQEVTLTLVDGDTVTSASTTNISGIPNIQTPYVGGSFTLHIETRTAASGTVDSASSTAFTIFGSQKTVKEESDAVPPVSKIAQPVSGAAISAGKPYAIYGTGTDAGGSLVKTVEVSVDGGKTWFEAQVSATGGNYNWEYSWQNPTAGEYTVQVRATDTVGNRESPSAGVKVVVAGLVTPLPTPTPTPAPTPAPETAIIKSLQQQVITLQQQLVVLLQQLLQLLQIRR